MVVATRGTVPPLWILAVTNAAGSVGLAAGGTAGPLLAAEMRGTAAAAGLPIGVLVAGSGAAALTMSWLGARRRRTSGLALGYAIGALGAVVVIAGAVAGGLGTVLAGCFLLGAANAAVFLTRYAAAELVAPSVRGRALATVLFAMTIGAVASPNLLGPAGRLAGGLRLPALTGLFVIAAVIFVGTALVLAFCSRGPAPAGRPEPPGDADGPMGAAVFAALRQPPVRTALIVLATANLGMVAIMAVVPVHLLAHGLDLGRVGLIVSAHVAAMFAPSWVMGWLADRAGSGTVAALGTVGLVVAGGAGMVLDLSRGAAVLLFLTVVGVAWNAAVVGGSALLASEVPARVRRHSEGLGETAMGLAAAVTAPSAGLLTARAGLGALGAAVILATVPALAALAAVARVRSVSTGAGP